MARPGRVKSSFLLRNGLVASFEPAFGVFYCEAIRHRVDRLILGCDRFTMMPPAAPALGAYPLRSRNRPFVNLTTAIPGRNGRAICRVTYRMTDQMGMVYYGNYLELFEMGRVELMRAAGVRYREMEEAGYLLPVTHASCDYVTPARYDELLEITTRVEKLTRAQIHFAYEVRERDEDR